jgi:hypothetical protein
MAATALIILDAGQFSIQCRSCHWRSDRYAPLASAQSAFQAHCCAARPVGSSTRALGGDGAACSSG